MNAKYCKLIRKMCRERGYPPAAAKRLKQDLIKDGITTPSYEFLKAVLSIVHSSVDIPEKK
jgi:hypothetical protein